LLCALDGKLGSDGAAAIADALKGRALEDLKLQKNNITSEGIMKLAEMLEVNTSLKTCDLSENNFGDDGGRALVAALRKNPASSLQDLDVYGCGLSSEVRDEIDDLVLGK